MAMAQGVWSTIASEINRSAQLLENNSISLYCDNKAAISIHSPVQHDQTEHTEIDYHFICWEGDRWNIEYFSCSI